MGAWLISLAELGCSGKPETSSRRRPWRQMVQCGVLFLADAESTTTSTSARTQLNAYWK
ncbi:hypothetical protein BHM03_00040638 [Ensete ventricosum]|nr:hypothetical protein BHM03_00040638 [Ensete ventricosum]